MYPRQLAFFIMVLVCLILTAAIISISAILLVLSSELEEAIENEVPSGPTVLIIAGIIGLAGGIMGLCGAITEGSKMCFGYFVGTIIAMIIALGGCIVTIYYREELYSLMHDRPVELGADTTSLIFHLIEKNSKCCGYTGVDNYLQEEDLLNVPPECCKDVEKCVDTKDIFDIDEQLHKFLTKGCRTDVVEFFKFWALIDAIAAVIFVAAGCGGCFLVNRFKGTPHY